MRSLAIALLLLSSTIPAQFIDQVPPTILVAGVPVALAPLALRAFGTPSSAVTMRIELLSAPAAGGVPLSLVQADVIVPAGQPASQWGPAFLTTFLAASGGLLVAAGPQIVTPNSVAQPVLTSPPPAPAIRVAIRMISASQTTLPAAPAMPGFVPAFPPGLPGAIIPFPPAPAQNYGDATYAWPMTAFAMYGWPHLNIHYFAQPPQLLPSSAGVSLERFTLNATSPSGPGSLALNIAGGLPHTTCATAITLWPGNFPYGWFFGVDISLTDLLNEVAAGPPFFVLLDGAGQFSFILPPPGALPSGLTLYAVSAIFNPYFVTATEPLAFTIP